MISLEELPDWMIEIMNVKIENPCDVSAKRTSMMWVSVAISE